MRGVVAGVLFCSLRDVGALMSKTLLTGMKYTSSAATNVAATFERFGFRTRTPEEQRKAAQAKLSGKPRKAKRLPGNVTPIKSKAAK